MQSIPPEFLPQWASLVASLKPAPGYLVTRFDEPIDDTVYPDERTAREACEEEADRTGAINYDFAPVTVQITVGFTPGESVTGGDDDSASWSYQTGDNSYSGGAYGHPVWGVVWISADSDPNEVAQEIAADIESQLD